MIINCKVPSAYREKKQEEKNLSFPIFFSFSCHLNAENLETILEERSKVWTRFLCVELNCGLCKNPAFTKYGI